MTSPILHRPRPTAPRRRIPVAFHAIGLAAAAVALTIAYLTVVADLVARID